MERRSRSRRTPSAIRAGRTAESTRRQTTETRSSQPLNASAGTPPKVGLIVRKNAAGAWFDDNNHDWTQFVSGALSSVSGRVAGWDLVDNDVAVIDTATRAVTYATGLMNLCMALAVNPGDGRVTLVGTEATNEVRFEPNVKGRFLRVRMGSFAAGTPGTTTIADLNPHLDVHHRHRGPEPNATSRIGDPRAIVWKADGSRGLRGRHGIEQCRRHRCQRLARRHKPDRRRPGPGRPRPR